MKTLILIIAFTFQFLVVSCQSETINYYFNYIGNAESLSGSNDPVGGLLLYFRFWNKDEKIGNGGGWLIYKKGTIEANELANKLYPNNPLKGMLFIKDLFQVKDRSVNVDSTMLKDFDIYLYIIDAKYLDKRLNTDGEGAGKTYSYYETYPLDINIFKRKAGNDYFLKIDTYHVENEDKYLETIKQISDFRKKTAIESNQ